MTVIVIEAQTEEMNGILHMTERRRKFLKEKKVLKKTLDKNINILWISRGDNFYELRLKIRETFFYKF